MSLLLASYATRSFEVGFGPLVVVEVLDDVVLVVAPDVGVIWVLARLMVGSRVGFPATVVSPVAVLLTRKGDAGQLATRVYMRIPRLKWVSCTY